MKKSLIVIAVSLFVAFQLSAQTNEEVVVNPNAPIITFE